MSCGLCGLSCHNAILVTVRDLFGKRRRVLVCPLCGDFVNARRKLFRSEP